MVGQSSTKTHDPWKSRISIFSMLDVFPVSAMLVFLLFSALLKTLCSDDGSFTASHIVSGSTKQLVGILSDSTNI